MRWSTVLFSHVLISEIRYRGGLWKYHSPVFSSEQDKIKVPSTNMYHANAAQICSLLDSTLGVPMLNNLECIFRGKKLVKWALSGTSLLPASVSGKHSYLLMIQLNVYTEV